MSSEISKLMQQIDAENEAAQQALHGIANCFARHSFISARYSRIGELQSELSDIVGHDNAMGMIIDGLNENEGTQ
jgi:hypothetical protein